MVLREVEAIRAKYDSELSVIPQIEYHKILIVLLKIPFVSWFVAVDA